MIISGGNRLSRRARASLSALILPLVAPQVAWGQDIGSVPPPNDPEAVQSSEVSAADAPRLGEAEDLAAPDAAISDDIIVTGTLVRGAAPTGANVIGVSEAEIAATGATTTAQLLQTIPQLGSFNNLQAPVGFGNANTVNRVNLRNLPGFNQAGGSSTLVLMDGRRLVGMGIASTSPDPDVIPPGALQRVEVVPDGGSAVYGSDAVAGVLNFITLKKFDGVKAESRYGFADNYHQFDAGITAGKDWGTGSAYVSYFYSEHSELFGRDRDYVRQFPAESGNVGLTSLQCSPGNVRIGTTYYRLPYGTANAAAASGVPNQCDFSDDATFYPKERRHAALIGLTQDLNEQITFDLKAFFTDRRIDITTGPFRVAQGQPQTVTAVAAGFAEHRVGSETSHAVFFEFGAPDAAGQGISLRTWGVTPTVTADLGGGWQLRVLGGYSESDTLSRQRSFNMAALNASINAGLFNVYDPSLSDPAAMAAIANSERYARTRQSLGDLSAIIDGELFSLPGGGVKIAAGGEYYHETFRIRTADQVVPGADLTGFPGLSLPRRNAPVGALVQILPAHGPIPQLSLSRNVKSAFAEVVVPIFGADNATTFFRELTLSAAGRYDSYNDVGSTFNPKFGITWRPTDWIKLRASWGESFNAPSLADHPSAQISNLAFSARLPPAALLVTGGGTYPVPAPGQVSAFIQGNLPGIRPQTAETLSIGADIQPPFLPGLNLGVTYYRIDLNGVITTPNTDAASAYGVTPHLVQRGPFTQQQINDLMASVDLVRNTCTPQPQCVYSIVDLRKRNLGDFQISGFDFTSSYDFDTSFGSISMGLNANYEFDRKQRVVPGDPFVKVPNAGDAVSTLKLRASAGAQIGNFLAQAVLNHTSGYKLATPVGFVGTANGVTYTAQERVRDFNVVNLFFRYDFKGEGLMRDLQFTLNVDNVFDADPPYYRGDPLDSAKIGFVHGLTLGRLVQFGISKRF